MLIIASERGQTYFFFIGNKIRSLRTTILYTLAKTNMVYALINAFKFKEILLMVDIS